MDSLLRRRVFFVMSLLGLGSTLWVITHPSPLYLGYANSNLGHYLVLPVDLLISAALAWSLCHLKSHFSDQRVADEEPFSHSLRRHSLRRFTVVFAVCHVVNLLVGFVFWCSLGDQGLFRPMEPVVVE